MHRTASEVSSSWGYFLNSLDRFSLKCLLGTLPTWSSSFEIVPIVKCPLRCGARIAGGAWTRAECGGPESALVLDQRFSTLAVH